MDAPTYEQGLCTNCTGLLHAGPETAVHRGLGRPRAEIGYDLYRCAVCHSRWSLGPIGWAVESS